MMSYHHLQKNTKKRLTAVVENPAPQLAIYSSEVKLSTFRLRELNIFMQFGSRNMLEHNNQCSTVIVTQKPQPETYLLHFPLSMPYYLMPLYNSSLFKSYHSSQILSGDAIRGLTLLCVFEMSMKMHYKQVLFLV